MNTLIDFFNAGMWTGIDDIIPIQGPGINLGGGAKEVAGFRNLQRPEWDAEVDLLPAEDGSIGAILAFHFFEHLTAERVSAVIRDCERALCKGGTLNICVPHRLSSMAYQDLDHKTFFCEDTWKTFLFNSYYDHPLGWDTDLRLTTNMIMGVNERNLALMTQFVRWPI